MYSHVVFQISTSLILQNFKRSRDPKPILFEGNLSSVVTVSKILLSVGFGRFCKKNLGFRFGFCLSRFPLSSMWYVYAAHCTSNLQQYVTYFCV